MFRVGQADETLPRRGLTHMVEHLALGDTGGDRRVDGRVDLLTTTLFFEGDADEVRAHLQAAAAALASPPTERLDVERRIMAVEDAAGIGAATYLLRLFYGARGPGLAAFHELGLRHAAPEDVVRHAREWFVRENAALVLVGDVGDLDGSLELAHGRRHEPSAPVPRPWATPAQVVDPDGAALALGAPTPTGAVTAVLATLLERRAWSALREERGLAYDVRCRTPLVGPAQRLLTLTTDVVTADAAAAGETLVEQVQGLAAGATGDEVAAAIRRVDREVRELQPLALLSVAASADLTHGRVKDVETVLAELAAVTPEDVAAAASAVAKGMLLASPVSIGSRLPTADAAAAGPPLDGRRFRTKLAPRHMGALPIVVGDEGVSAMVDDERAATVRFASCAAAVREMDGGLSLIDDSGASVTLDPGDLRDGHEAVAAAEARLDPGLVVGLDSRSARIENSPGRRLRPVLVGEAAELLVPRLGSDEQVFLTTEANRGMHAGVLAVTDRRVLFVAKLFSEYVEEIPLRAIERLHRRPNPLWPSLRVTHGQGKVGFSFLTVSRLNEAADAIAAARRGAP